MPQPFSIVNKLYAKIVPQNNSKFGNLNSNIYYIHIYYSFYFIILFFLDYPAFFDNRFLFRKFIIISNVHILNSNIFLYYFFIVCGIFFNVFGIFGFIYFFIYTNPFKIAFLENSYISRNYNI